MKMIAKFYKNEQHIDEGTTKYFLAINDAYYKENKLLPLMLMIGLLPNQFIDEEQGQLQIEKISYSLADSDELIGTFWDKYGVVVYEQN